MKKAVFAIAAVLILFLLAVIVGFNVYYNVQNAEVKPAPLFSEKDLDGQWVNLTDSRGTIVVLDFVYFDEGTCPKCLDHNLEVFEILEKLNATYGGQIEIIVVDMTSDPSGDRIRDLRERYAINLTIINDYFPGSNTNRKFNDTNIGGKYWRQWTALGEMANPTVVILDQDLNFRYNYQVTINKGGVIMDNDDVDLTYSLLADNIDDGLEDDWPSTVEGNYVSPQVQLLGMFVLGVFISVTPCALAIFVSMTTYVLSTRVKERKKKEEKESKGEEGGYVQLTRKKGSLISRIARSNELYGGLIGLSFTLGIGTVFFVLGTLILYVSSVVKENATFFTLFFILGGCVIIFLGVNNLKSIVLMVRYVVEKIKPSDPEKEHKQGFYDRVRFNTMSFAKRFRILGAYFLGIILALGWAPCILSYVFPIFILVSYQEINFLMGGVYMFVMALGFGVPITLVSAISLSVKGEVSQNLIGVGKVVKIVISVLMIIFGAYLIISSIFPKYALSTLLGL